MAEKAKRNEWLDVVKFLTACVVVFVHIKLSDPAWSFFNVFSRSTIPLFFAISGYFSVKADVRSIKKRLSKIIGLYLFATILYHVLNLVICFGSSGISGVEYYISTTFNLTRIIGYLFFNSPLSSDHLWFLLGLIYVYAVWIFVRKFALSDKTIFIISIICLFVNLILGEGLSFFGINISAIYVRNFVLMGFPAFGLGYLANKHIDKFIGIKTWLLVLMLIVGVASAITAMHIVGYMELYVGSIFQSFATFFLAIKAGDRKVSPLLKKIAATSTDVYIYHFAISKVCLFVLERLFVPITSIWFVNIWPITVCILCVLFSWGKNFVMSKIRERISEKNKALQYICEIL